MDEDARRTYEFRKSLAEKLIRSAKRKKIPGGKALDVGEFDILLCNGGRITEQQAPYVDNCYIARLECRGVIFKTLTEFPQDFYPPF